MILRAIGYSNKGTIIKEATLVDNSSNFLEKLHDTQEKAERNKKRQGNGNPGKKKPNKTHK